MSATSSRRTTRHMRRRVLPADATDKTKHLWKYLDDNYLSVERKQRVYDVDTHTPAGIDAFPAGYIDSPEVDNVIVGLQTDVPCKRAMMPNGGWRMVEQAIKEAGKEPDPEIKKIFTKYRKTHNDGVFGVYTKQIKVARHNKILTGLPDAYAAAASSAITVVWPCTA